MLEMFKCLKNNKNGKNYAIVKSDLRFKKADSKDEETKDGELSQADVKKRLNELETTIRYNNLRVFEDTYKTVKNRRFKLFTFPAILVAVTALLFTAPSEYTSTDKVDTYVKNHLVFDNGVYSVVDDDMVYCDTLGNPEFLDETYTKLDIDGDLKYLKLYVTEGLESVYGKFCFNKETGKMYLDSRTSFTMDVGEGNYALDQYTVQDGEEIPTSYKDMFDCAVAILTETPYLSDEAHEMINRVNDEDKSAFVGELIEYEFTGEKEVEVVKSAMFIKIISAIVTALYIGLYAIPVSRKRIIQADSLEVNEENLHSCSTYDNEHRANELPLEYKSAFMTAERNRILKIAELADKYLTPECKEELLSSYEKKLILK